ncbi:hypothetical protein SLA2020_036600 [Shorea laevis]
MEAQKYIWEGAIPLQIHLHESDVTTHPRPSPALILAPRLGYLPLLASLIKPHFSATLPPGVDTIWFEYKGLPLKWYIPTGVLFDLLCAEPERPWNLTVHFRGYPGNLLTPCEGEDSVKWSFINSLKEAAYIITGNCKNVMNMSQSDQVELWDFVMNGNLEGYLRVSSKLKLGTIDDEYAGLYSSKSRQGSGEKDLAGQVKTGRIPVRLPVEIPGEGRYLTLLEAVKSILPEYFSAIINKESARVCIGDGQNDSPEDASSNRSAEDLGENTPEHVESCTSSNAVIKLLRIQGIEPKFEIPFSWVVNNLMNPEYFLHICVHIISKFHK